MSTPKGWPTQEKDDRLKSEFATVEPVRPLQHAMSVLSHEFVREVGTDAVEASSTTYVINATAHAAQKGDVIRFTSGTHSGKEVKVVATATDTITLGETLTSAPATAVTFQILRHKYPLVGSDGTIPVSATLAAAPVQFVLDGVDTEVLEDTVTPANNRPLPVKLVGTTGTLTVTAQQLNVQSTHTGASPDSMQIGDGTETLSVTASGQAEVAVTAALPAGTNNIGDVDVLSLPALPAGTNNIGDVDVLSLPSIPAGTNNIGDVDVLSLPAIPAGTNNIGDVDVLTQPARSHATDSIRIGDGTDLALVTAAGELNVIATAQPGVDIGDVTVNNAAGASAVNIQDGGNSITVDGTVAVTRLDVVDFIDGANSVLDTSSTNIPGSGGSPVTLVASLAANVKAIQIMDTTGGFVGIYTGAAAAEVLQAIYGPGSDSTIEVAMSSGERVSAKRLDSVTALSSGVLAINFLN